MDEILRTLQELARRIAELEKFKAVRAIIFPADGVLRPPVVAGDPSSPTEGDIWYDVTNHRWRGRKNGSTVTFTTS